MSFNQPKNHIRQRPILQNGFSVSNGYENCIKNSVNYAPCIDPWWLKDVAAQAQRPVVNVCFVFLLAAPSQDVFLPPHIPTVVNIIKLFWRRSRKSRFPLKLKQY